LTLKGRFFQGKPLVKFPLGDLAIFWGLQFKKDFFLGGYPTFGLTGNLKVLISKGFPLENSREAF